MAFLVVPVAGGALGGLTGVALSWSYTQAANLSASKLYGLEEAYPWPIYKPWFDSRAKTNTTNKGTLAAALFGIAAFSLQRRFIFHPLGRQIWGKPPPANVKLENFVQFAKQVGPGLGEAALSLTSTTVLIGFVRPLLDGNNLQHTHHAHHQKT